MDDKRKTDRHVNSTTFTIRIDYNLLHQFDTKRQKEGKSRREIIINWIESYCGEKKINCSF